MKSHGFVVRVLRAKSEQPLQIETHPNGQTFASIDSFRFYLRPTAGERALISADAIVLFDGFVDNREELARLLAEPELARAPDAEVVLTAYRAWGRDFAARVIGEYAFALFDRRSQTLYAGRDALGIAQCFYSASATELRIASDLELLIRTMPDPPELDRAGLIDLLADCGYSAHEKTVFRGIEQVDPATQLELRDGSVRKYRYWTPNPNAETRFRKTEEYGEALRAQLFDAVRARLRNPGAVLADLSGGLDSSAIASIAARLNRAGEGPALYANCYFDPNDQVTDDRRWQQLVLEKHPLPVCELDPITAAQMKQEDDEPWGAPGHRLQQGGIVAASKRLAADRNIRVHLVGHMGDEVFCGNHFPPLYLAEWIRKRRFRAWAYGIAGELSKTERSLWNLLTVCTRGSLAAGADQHRGQNVSPRWLAPGIKDDFAELVRARRIGGPRSFEASAAREYHFRSIDMSARRISGLAFGLRQIVRAPFAHRPLIELMLSIPWEQKVLPHEDRIIMREALRGILPEEIRTRRDKGQGRGTESVALEANRDHLRGLARGDYLAALGLVDPVLYRESCARFLCGFAEPGTRRFFSGAFLIEAWLQQGGASSVKRFPAGELVYVDRFNDVHTFANYPHHGPQPNVHVSAY
jgi:asparagine synthase (glutamine-hydrolysing)